MSCFSHNPAAADSVKDHNFVALEGAEQLAAEGQRQRRAPGHRPSRHPEPDLQRHQERKTSVTQPRPEARPLPAPGPHRAQVSPRHSGRNYPSSLLRPNSVRGVLGVTPTGINFCFYYIANLKLHDRELLSIKVVYSSSYKLKVQ